MKVNGIDADYEVVSWSPAEPAWWRRADDIDIEWVVKAHDPKQQAALDEYISDNYNEVEDMVFKAIDDDREEA